MRLRKILAVVLAAMMTMSMAACSDSETQETSTEATTTTEQTSEETTEETAEAEESTQTESRTVVVGTVGTGEPYSLVADDGTWTGVEAELWAEVAERTGWTIEMKQVSDLASLFGELDTGRVDVAANCYAITEARLENYVASDPLYADAQVIIVQPDSEYQTFEDLRGCTIGVTAGQAAQTTVETMAPEYDWEVITYEDSTAGFQDCALGRVDAYANTITNIEKAERAQGLEFRQLEEKLFGNNVGWWFADTEEGIELRDAANEVLKEMQEDGTVANIVTEWFYEDLTQLISNDWLTATRVLYGFGRTYSVRLKFDF